MTGSAAAILLRLASAIASDELAMDLRVGRLDGAITSLPAHDLNETLRDLVQRKADLTKRGEQDAVAVLDLVRDRVVAEQRIRGSG